MQLLHQYGVVLVLRGSLLPIVKAGLRAGVQLLHLMKLILHNLIIILLLAVHIVLPLQILLVLQLLHLVLVVEYLSLVVSQIVDDDTVRLILLLHLADFQVDFVLIALFARGAVFVWCDA